MQIGAGGLQPYVVHDIVKEVAAALKPKAGVQETLVQAQGRDANMLKEELNRAVEHLNKMANALNHPIQVVIKEPPPRLRVILKDKRTGQEKEINLEELPQLADQIAIARGMNVDRYAE